MQPVRLILYQAIYFLKCAICLKTCVPSSISGIRTKDRAASLYLTCESTRNASVSVPFHRYWPPSGPGGAGEGKKNKTDVMRRFFFFKIEEQREGVTNKSDPVLAGQK